MVNDLSVTSMSHTLIKELSFTPFEDLLAEGYDGTTHCLSLDQLRRLYNDAVESMLAYRRHAVSLEDKLEECRSYASRLENRLQDFADTEPLD